MKSDSPKLTTIDDYISGYPSEIQAILQEVRATIQKAAPGATEKISYQLPTFYLSGNLVHFGAFKKHIGFYPTSSGIANFTEELAPYQTSRGAVQFPLVQPIPLNLITKIVEFRVRENLERAKEKAATKKKI